MLYESSCTLYKFNGIGFDRYYINSCHWQENRASNVLKSGLQSADSVTVYIQADELILCPNESQLPATYIFPNMELSPQSTARDMLVKGDCKFTFVNDTQQTVSESMKEFRKLYPQFVTVSSIDRKLYGSAVLRHIKLSAK
jgi:hypothetical protein